MGNTIIDLMYNIREKMRNETGAMAMSNTGKAKDEIDALAARLNLTSIQSVFLTAIVQRSGRYRLDTDDIASLLDLDYLDFLRYDSDLETLRKRGYIRIDLEGQITMPKHVLKALKNDQDITPETVSGLSTGQILVRIKRQLSFLENNEQSIEEVCEMVWLYITENPDTSISRTFARHRRMNHIIDKELIVLCALIFRYWFKDDDMVGWHDMDDYFEDDVLEDMRSSYYVEHLMLQRCGIIEFTSEGGMLTKDYFHIKDDIKAEIFADVGGLKQKKQQVSASRKLEAGQISPKALFYNDAEGRQVEQLRLLLSEKRYAEIRSKIKEKGLRTGFSCLLYGGPGTGKTETVYQLARECGRDLYIVDVSQIKSCWVGETEKNIKDVFNKYRACVASGSTVPILLFNEADAIFGIRQEGASRAVDKMENSMQNIILQEMEDLDGILIATTNLTQNLDRAFERRFLYKVRFNKPSMEAKTHIWQTMIPSLSDGEAEQLAREFDLSGGQIENVARKKAISDIIGLSDSGFDAIRTLCSEETITRSAPIRKIGY
ncbi:MAG: AAA family ATPase [Bacteroidales bacterium]|nr:AAA family ATPase [Bacteroidales bacterium]